MPALPPCTPKASQPKYLHGIMFPSAPDVQDFVVAVHGRAAKAAAEGKMSPRADIMLSLVLDIKNNRRRDRASGPAAVLSSGVISWLKQCHVGQVQLKGLTWEKLLSPNKKVGMVSPCRHHHRA